MVSLPCYGHNVQVQDFLDNQFMKTSRVLTNPLFLDSESESDLFRNLDPDPDPNPHFEKDLDPKLKRIQPFF